MPRLYEVTYHVRADGGRGSFFGPTRLLVRAPSRKAARRRAFEWCDRKDPYYDHRIDPVFVVDAAERYEGEETTDDVLKLGD